MIMRVQKFRKFMAIALVFALLGSFLTGCSKGRDPGASEKVLIIGYDQDAEIMDSIRTAWYSDALIYIHDRLVTRDYEFGYKPGLAERWDLSDKSLQMALLLCVF
jgi:peptide/nickel transport system substrate-binding protein